MPKAAESDIGPEGAPTHMWEVLVSDTFVGRREALTTLHRLVDGSGGSLRSGLIEGEAGIGKTRLVTEFVEQACQKGIRVLQGYCYRVKEAGPYFPLLQILSGLQEAGSRSGNLLRGSADVALTRGVQSLSEDLRSQRSQFLSEVSDAILRASASRETLVCVEDIHWADIGSLLVLNNLLDMRTRNLSIICTARMDEPMEVEVRQLVARIEEKSRRIVLHGLAQAEAREFVESLAGPGAVTDEELRVLRSFTNGNPMFLRELFFHFQETGLLARHTIQEAIKRTRMPDRLSHVIDLQLARLPGDVRRVLSAASVIGAEFSADLVARVLAEAEIDVQARLEIAIANRILQPIDALEASRYRFAHALFATGLYESLLASERRDLHRRVAEAIDTGVVSLSAGEVARHHALGFGVKGGRRTVERCRVAAEQAENIMAFETAARFWEYALRCTRPRSQRTRAELYRRLGRALRAAGKWTQAVEAWREAARLFEYLEDWKKVGDLALALGEMHRLRQEYAESERWLELALKLCSDRPADRGKALALLGSIRCLEGETGQGLQLLEEASQTGASTGGDPVVAFWLSQGFLASGNPARAQAVAKKGLEDAQRRGISSAVALLAAGLVHHELSRLSPRSARSYARLLQEAVDPTDTTALTRSLLCQTLLLAYAGNWRKVLSLCERWMAQVRFAGRYQVATARVIWAEARLALGDALVARTDLLRSLPHLEHMRPVAALHLARILLRLGEEEEATSLVSRHWRQLASDARPTSAAGRALLGEVVSSLNQPELARRCYDSLLREPRPIVIGYSPLSVQRVLGCLAAHLKMWSSAIEHFETAMQQLAEGGARWELAQTYLDYRDMRRVRWRRGDLRKAAALELEAEAILSELGIQDGAVQRTPVPSPDGGRFGLTTRELEVLALLAEGRRNQEIAEALTLSRGTVNRHLENIYMKMEVNNRTEAVVQAVKEGLVGPLARASSAGRVGGQEGLGTAQIREG